MKIIAGLGNPEEKYKNTRHNAGFILVDKLAQEKNLVWEDNSKLNSKIAKFGDTLFVKPQLFMNNSGKCLSSIVSFYKVSPKDLYVIHDDVDLPFGKIRKSFDSTSAGHNGVGDIIEHLGTKAFTRVRIGIGKPDDSTNISVSDFVLMPFSDSELEFLKNINLTTFLPLE